MYIVNPVQTKFGMISVDSLIGPRSEEDRIKIYDSDDRYLDYFSVEELYNSACEMETTLEEEYALRLKSFREEENLETLVSLLTTDCEKITDNPQGLDVESEYVNRIGNHYILMKD